MLFAVGSTNPIKIRSVAEAVSEFWPEACVTGVSVESNVAAQPKGDVEIRYGAIHRARMAIAARADATHGVGVEGGVLDSDGNMWAFAWVVIVDRQGRIGQGRTGQFLLPSGIAGLVRSGLELGEADDLFFGRMNSKQNEGAIGLLSDKRITRLTLYKQGVTFALLPFVHPEYYSTSESVFGASTFPATVQSGLP